MGSGLCVSKARGAAFCGPLLWVGVIGGRIITAVGLFELQEEKGRKKTGNLLIFFGRFLCGIIAA